MRDEVTHEWGTQVVVVGWRRTGDSSPFPFGFVQG